MNDFNAVLAGRIEDKWVEFVAVEVAEKRGAALRTIVAAEAGLRTTMRRVEVHASYFWLLAGAVVAYVVR